MKRQLLGKLALVLPLLFAFRISRTDNQSHEIIVNERSQNIQITNSYTITNEDEQKEIINELYQKYEWWRVRSQESYLIEWQAHNTLYNLGICRDRTKDVDLNVDEKPLRLIGYNILGIL